MRGERFGSFVAILAFVWIGIMAWHVLRPLHLRAPEHAKQANAEPHVEAQVELESIKRDLCQIALTEQAFFRSTGHYADENELRLNGNKNLRTTVGPYHVAIRVPTGNEFVIVATAYGRLAQFPPALTVDKSGRICALVSNVPRLTSQLDLPKQKWGDTSYDCEPCR